MRVRWRRRGQGWTPVQAEVVTDQSIPDGVASITNGLADSFTLNSAVVIRLRHGGPELQCKVARNDNNPARIRFSEASGEVLGITGDIKALEIRERGTADGMRNLKTIGTVAAAAPFLVAVLAIVPGVLWPAPSGNDAAQVNAVWQNVVASLAGTPGNTSGLLSSLTEPPNSTPASRIAEAKAVGQRAIVELTGARKQAAAIDARFSSSTEAQQRDHNRAVVAQIVLAAIVAFSLFCIAAIRIFKGP
jgi:hypothetical protein